MDADKILQAWPFEAILRAARLGARRKKMHHAEYIIKKLETDTNMEAEKLRNAEKYYLTNQSRFLDTH